ncbi:TRP (predicted) [Pycnogonum litorale]
MQESRDILDQEDPEDPSESKNNGLLEVKVSPTTQQRSMSLNAYGELTWQEKKFLLHVERGDVASIKRLLETYCKSNELNIDCVDPLGRSALVIAIENENYDLIELLLMYGVKVQNALLHAIKEEYVEAVELLLEHEEKIHQPGQSYSWEEVDAELSYFTNDITPLILAAQKDNYEILKLLLDREATLPAPHDVRCGCDECVVGRKDDCLRHSRARISAYTALSSPSLIALSSKDPILTSFALTEELRRLACIENEFKAEYKKLAKKCQDFVTSLLEHTRTSEELEILLNYDPNAAPSQETGRMKLQRIKEAITYRQKQFVAHPHVQQLLASVWYEGMPGFRRKGQVMQALEVCKMGAMFPLFCLVYMMCPWWSLAHRLKNPFTKFIVHSASYVFFLLLLVLESQRVEGVVIATLDSDGTVGDIHELQSQRRGALPSYVQVGIIIYVFGFVWSEVRKLWRDGFQQYAKNMWNIVEVIVNSLYLIWLALRIASVLEVRSEIASGIDPNIPRVKWDAFDPMLIAEGVFGAANIFSFLKLVHIFSVNPYLGPLQVSLGRMLFDILKFFFIYTLVMFAFACGINQLLWYYSDMDFQTCKALPRDEQSPHNDGPCKIWRRFSNLFETSQSLFWASFGLIDLESFDMAGIKGFTRYWGLLMFGTYSVINVVVLLNLLIAMMSNSYNFISMRADMEWKFARSQLWMSYFEDGRTLPSPFNIIPSVKTIINVYSYCCGLKKYKGTVKRKFVEDRDRRYQRVIRSLVRRYITNQQRRNDSNDVTEDDVNELKQQVSSFRYEMIDILKNNGWRVNSTNSDILNVGKRERQKERRLLKGFNSSIFEKLMDAMNDGEQIEKNPFETLARMTSLKKAKKNWNALMVKIQANQNHVGFTRGSSFRNSLDALRKEVDDEERRIRNAGSSNKGIHDYIDDDDSISTGHLRGKERFKAVARSMKLRPIPDDLVNGDKQTQSDFQDDEENEESDDEEDGHSVPLEVETIIQNCGENVEAVVDDQLSNETPNKDCENNIIRATENKQLATKERASTTSDKRYAVRPVDRKPKGSWM